MTTLSGVKYFMRVDNRRRGEDSSKGILLRTVQTHDFLPIENLRGAGTTIY